MTGWIQIGKSHLGARQNRLRLDRRVWQFIKNIVSSCIRSLRFLLVQIVCCFNVREQSRDHSVPPQQITGFPPKEVPGSLANYWQCGQSACFAQHIVVAKKVVAINNFIDSIMMHRAKLDLALLKATKVSDDGQNVLLSRQPMAPPPALRNQSALSF